jgi:hypothetical protein
MRTAAFVLCLLLVPLLQIYAGEGEIGGYVKYLFSRSDLPVGGILYDHLLHARINTKWYPTQDLSGILEVRARAFYGGTVEQTPGFSDALGHDAGFGKLGAIVWKDTKSVGYVEADRLYINWSRGPVQTTVGRQRIAWGTNLVWNPIDLFNPLSVLDFDYEERPAVDAVRIQYYTGEVSKIEAAVKPGNATSGTVTAVQWTANRWKYDFHFLGGRKSGEWFFGTGWAGDIEGGGFRGEILGSGIPAYLRTTSTPRVMVSGALSGDYTFPSSFYIHTEVLYNSEGATSNASQSRTRATELGLLSPARWSVFQELAYDVSPLVRADVFALHNPNDGSSVVVPSVTWSVVTNLDAMALALFFTGAGQTEFGKLGSIVFIRAKWSF